MDTPLLTKQTNTLNLLVVSDTHGYYQMLDKLEAWVNATKPTIDYVIFPGDFTNIFPNETSDPTKVKDAETMVLKTVAMLSSISKTQVIYIPGNHEPPSQYNGELKPVGGKNIHKSFIKIADNLVIIGQGGSLPGMQVINGKNTQIWEPFPYKTDEDYRKDLEPNLNSAFALSPDYDYILLTHIGPINSSTAIMNQLNANPVYSGSQYLADALFKYQDRIVCNIHGHTHTCDGKQKFTSKTMEVINPGAMKLGYFATMQLVKKANGHWRLNDVNFHCIDDNPVE
jgi:Icc-related predicted phosphoesterase